LGSFPQKYVKTYVLSIHFQTVMNFFEAVVGGWHHIFSARMHHAKLWTQDAHFDGISGVSFIRKTGVESSI